MKGKELAKPEHSEKLSKNDIIKGNSAAVEPTFNLVDLSFEPRILLAPASRTKLPKIKKILEIKKVPKLQPKESNGKLRTK